MSLGALIPILLLKSPSPSPSSDPYTTHFPSPPYHPRHITPLSTTPLVPPLLAILSTPTCSEYSAWIFTSQRAVSSLLLAFPVLEPERREYFKRVHIPLYAVGPGTATALRKDVVGAGNWMPGCWAEGEEAGRGEALVEIIAARCAENEEPDPASKKEKKKKKVLWLTGEKRRESLRTGLLDAGVKVELCIAYRTTLSDSFLPDFRHALATTEPAKVGGRWILFFSTQGVREVLDGLGWLDQGTGRVKGEDEEERRRRTTFVASIGATTAEYLEREFGFSVDVCADKPSPEGVRVGIEGFMRERGEYADG